MGGGWPEKKNRWYGGRGFSRLIYHIRKKAT
jgi:hypothetical protein